MSTQGQEHQAQLLREAAGRLRLEGDLSFATVPGLLAQAENLFGAGDDVVVDLASVGRSDSAGLGLLVEWMRAARRRGLDLTFVNMPDQMLAIARVSSLDNILPIGRE